MHSSTSSVEPAMILEGKVRIKCEGRHLFLCTKTIPWIEAAGNYVRIWVDNAKEPYVVRVTMLAMQNQLNPQIFVRIHRSAFVNRHRIRELRPWYTGEYIVTLDSGKELMLSRGYRHAIPRLLATGNVYPTEGNFQIAAPAILPDHATTLTQSRDEATGGRASEQ